MAAAILLVLTSVSGYASAQGGKDGGPSGAFTYSKTASVAAVQRRAKHVVETYQTALNNSDFDTIRTLFAPNAIAEWNNKATVVGVAAMEEPYKKLFQETKFTTDFQYDAVDIHGSIAIVRTHHPQGQTEMNLEDGSTKLDFNREIFVLSKESGDWKIILYTFTTQPEQGVQ
ncbi:MAG: nuclear transport factor 2 family protein [Rhizonema sp. PD37]|nr:nuclear transport factor 2 family protein [Rhizonema sp. PD37]